MAFNAQVRNAVWAMNISGPILSGFLRVMVLIKSKIKDVSVVHILRGSSMRPGGASMRPGKASIKPERASVRMKYRNLTTQSANTH